MDEVSGRSGTLIPLVTEKSFPFQCSQGHYGVDSIHNITSDGDILSFHLFQPFESGLDRFAVWFDKPGPAEGESSCFYKDSVAAGAIDQSFVAKCKHGKAIISMYGGAARDTLFNQVGIDTTVIPDAHCQTPLDAAFPEYNPNKRCYWEFEIDCSATGRKPRRLDRMPAKSLQTDLPLHQDVSILEASSHCPASMALPLQIEHQTGHHISFKVSQLWKGCDEGEEKSALNWLAVDFDDKNGGLTCARESSLFCNQSIRFESVCSNGIAIVDIFVIDENLLAGNETVLVPAACGAPKYARNTCHYRYLLQCRSSSHQRAANVVKSRSSHGLFDFFRI
jgi:hypothetical protein